MVQNKRLESSPASRPKAVIFTHFGSLRFVDDLLNDWNELIADYTQIIKSYLKCDHIALVYAYVDWGLKTAAPHIEERGRDFGIKTEVLRGENQLIDLLQIAETNARQELGIDRNHPPSFHYVGVRELVGLVNNIVEVDPQLLAFLHGPEKEFTYDSPKFVEAVIRLARGHTEHLANHPIIRIDEDAQPNTSAIEHLLDTYQRVCRQAPFFFFSGTYGDPNGGYDPVNDHAVRTHWFVDLRTQTPHVDQIKTFLADFNELGATQLKNSPDYYSKALQKLITANKRPVSSPLRLSAQGISGAGLIMSSRAVNLLPPFMNFTNLTTWVDDHLKRRLHEALGDIGVKDVECVEEARIKQDRHPGGVTQKAVKWAGNLYLDRLLRGCLFRRLITELDGTPTEYSKLIGKIVQFRVSDRDLQDKALQPLKDGMVGQAGERYEEVLTCWASDEFDGFESYKWAEAKLKNSSTKDAHKREACNAVVEDAISYIRLVHKWPIFTRAIERLPFRGNLWLYDPVD